MGNKKCKKKQPKMSNKYIKSTTKMIRPLIDPIIIIIRLTQKKCYNHRNLEAANFLQIHKHTANKPTSKGKHATNKNFQVIEKAAK